MKKIPFSNLLLIAAILPAAFAFSADRGNDSAGDSLKEYGVMRVYRPGYGNKIGGIHLFGPDGRHEQLKVESDDANQLTASTIKLNELAKSSWEPAGQSLSTETTLTIDQYVLERSK